MKKLILITLLTVSLLNIKAQPLIIKQYQNYGSCLVLKNIIYDFTANITLIKLAVYNDYNDYRKDPSNIIYVWDLPLTGIVLDPRNDIASYLKNNVTWFNTSLIATLKQLPQPPDTLWFNISPSPLDSAVRKIGIYSYKDDPLGHICELDGWVTHVKLDSLGRNIDIKYNQNLVWILDNTDSIQVSANKYLHSYDYFKAAQEKYNWTDSMTMAQGVLWSDPKYINDRLTY